MGEGQEQEGDSEDAALLEEEDAEKEEKAEDAKEAMKLKDPDLEDFLKEDAKTDLEEEEEEDDETIREGQEQEGDSEDAALLEEEDAGKEEEAQDAKEAMKLKDPDVEDFLKEDAKTDLEEEEEEDDE